MSGCRCVTLKSFVFRLTDEHKPFISINKILHNISYRSCKVHEMDEESSSSESRTESDTTPSNPTITTGTPLFLISSLLSIIALIVFLLSSHNSPLQTAIHNVNPRRTISTSISDNSTLVHNINYTTLEVINPQPPHQIEPNRVPPMSTIAPQSQYPENSTPTHMEKKAFFSKKPRKKKHSIFLIWNLEKKQCFFLPLYSARKHSIPTKYTIPCRFHSSYGTHTQKYVLLFFPRPRGPYT